MKIKSLVLGTAAGALAVTGAQAADLPVAPEPIDYVRVCDAFGPGYYFIPGTDTCLRVAGRIRTDYNYFYANDEWVALSGTNIGTSRRTANAYRFRARAYIYMDSRTNTEFGLLRTFTEIQGQLDSGQGTNTNLRLWRAFIQFGGLTFGRTQSFYDFLPPAFGQFLNVGYSDVSTLVAAYTFAFGNGFSASLSLETEENRRSGIANPFGFAGGFYGGNYIPDIVGALRVDQGWGSAQLMGALHNVRTVGAGSEYGWAIGAGVSVNVPFGSGTSVNLQGGYTQGALSYVAATPVGGVLFGPANNPGGISTATDGVIDANGNLELVDAWSISGGFETAFTPTISYVAQAGYVDVSHSGAGVGNVADFQNLGLEGTLAYSPISGFVFALGAQYQYVFLDNAPARFDDPQVLSVFFRAQRTF